MASSVKVAARAPTRIDLAGGTLDLWPIHQLLERKATVNVGVTLPAAVEVRTAPDGRYRLMSVDQARTTEGDFRAACATRELPLFGLLLDAIWSPELPALSIESTAKSPAGAGLGGSSCLGVTLAAALLAARQRLTGSPALSEHDLVRLVRDVEAKLIHAPTGVQDYWGAVRGRVNVLSFARGRTDVETFPAPSVAGLADELILCYSGQSRASAINNWEIFKRLFDGDRALLATFNEIGAAAEACAAAVRSGDLARVIELSEAEWRLRVKLWPSIETPDTQRLDRAARDAGARFSRVCGAGGGGVMAVFAPPARRSAVSSALAGAGGQVLPAGVAETGLAVEVS